MFCFCQVLTGLAEKPFLSINDESVLSLVESFNAGGDAAHTVTLDKQNAVRREKCHFLSWVLKVECMFRSTCG